MRWCYSYEDLIRRVIVTFVQRFGVYKNAFTNVSLEPYCDRGGAPEADRSADLPEVSNKVLGLDCVTCFREGLMPTRVGASEGWAVAHLEICIVPLPRGPNYIKLNKDRACNSPLPSQNTAEPPSFGTGRKLRTSGYSALPVSWQTWGGAGNDLFSATQSWG